MKSIAFIAQKGGSGKTTLSVHIAICAIRQNIRTALIDLDPQGSAYDWNESRPKHKKIDSVKANPGQLAALLQHAKKAGIDLTIIDTAPHSDSAAAIAAQHANLVLIPCRPARFDLKAIWATTQIINLTKTLIAVVINAAPRGKIAEEARNTLQQQGVLVAAPILYHRVAYSYAVIDGRSVHEYEPNGKAATEIDKLFLYIQGLLKK